MNSTFFEKSKTIADHYIQSIVFLDDKAYLKEVTQGQNIVNDLDAYKISKCFAKKNKICAIYDPETIEDIEDFKLISNKADIVILDWFIDINEELKADDDPDEEVPEDRIHGKYTLNVIKYLVDNQDNNSLKLILIYTGDVNLDEILTQISALNTSFDVNDANLELSINNIKILVRAKSNSQEESATISKDIENSNSEIKNTEKITGLSAQDLENDVEDENKAEEKRFKYLEQHNSKVLKYAELPEFLLEEFTKMTSGLLSNFALLSLTTLRQNSSKLLGLFNKDLDSAYLGHKSVLPNQNDSELLLIELFASSLIDILKYENIDNFIQSELINSYIDTIPDLNLGKFIRKNTLLQELLLSKIEDVNQRYETLLPNSLSKKEKLGFPKDSTKLFIDKNEADHIFNINKDFARLTHHKNIFLPSTTLPKLNLGTIIRSIHNNQHYYVCIQQRCDSVRITRDSERKFLFIPLNVVIDKPFNILTTEGIKLKVESKSFSLRTIKFISENNNGVVEAVNQGGKFIFNQKYRNAEDEQFEWVLDLKDLHAQRIVAEYASTLSRVGLDESEWLRNSAK